MPTVSQIRRDYRQAGAVHALLAPFAFIADDVFLTKAGHVGTIWRLQGVDSEGLDHAQRAAVAARCRTALALLDERFRLYSYLVKSPTQALETPAAAHPIVLAALTARTAALAAHAGDLFDVELYLVVMFEQVKAMSTSAQLQRGLRSVLALNSTVAALDQDLSSAVDALTHAANGIDAHLDDVVHPRRLQKAEAFQFLRRLVNYSGPTIPLKYDTYLDYFMADAPVTVTKHLEVGDARVAVLTMKEAPAQTFAGLLDDVAALPVSCIACLEWHRIPNDVMRRGITARTKHYDGIRGKTQNESLDARRAQHDAALLEMDVHGRSFGDCSLTLVLHHPDPARVERAAADARKLLAIREGVLLEETYNMLYAWVAIVPGNGAYNLRRLPLLDTHAADLAFVFAPDHGHRDAAVAVLEARHGALYHYALHCEDVGHTLVLGKTGSGKSFLLNFLILHLQQRDPHTVIFDLGHSYRTLTGQLGGSYVELGRQGTVTINPFALPATPENFHFLHAFCRVLIDGEDGFRITASDDHDLYASIVRLYAQPHDGRRLRDLDVPRRLYDRLEPWVRAGRWAETFDNLEDTLDLADLQVFEFEGMQMYPQLVEAVVFYILHRLNAKLQERRRLTVCVMDEAWRFIKHPKLRDYVEEALKTWRKMNGSMILATQAVEDFLASDLQRTVIESCHTKLLLANPDLSREAYATALSLNETELDLVTGLIPKRQVLLKRASTTKVLNVHVDPMSAALFAAKGLSHATAS